MPVNEVRLLNVNPYEASKTVHRSIEEQRFPPVSFGFVLNLFCGLACTALLCVFAGALALGDFVWALPPATWLFFFIQGMIAGIPGAMLAVIGYASVRTNKTVVAMALFAVWSVVASIGCYFATTSLLG